MSLVLDEVAQVGHDVTSVKYYSVALVTLLFYDYFLTLPDEISYTWGGKKSWVFAIFFVNRYMPMAYAIWSAVSNYSWAYTYETAFIEIAFLVWCTLIAQIVLNARIYAITMKNVTISGLFLCITVSQCALGIYLTTLAANAPAQKFPPIPLTAYQLCIFGRHRKEEIAYTTISLVYDFSAFLVIIFVAAKSGVKSFKVSGILRTIIQDATTYFFVIFTSHFVLEMALLLARPSLQLLPAIGNVVYLPIMIGRLMLSLRKAANKNVEWSLTSVVYDSNLVNITSERLYGVRFAPISEEGTMLSADEDIPLAVVQSPMA